MNEVKLNSGPIDELTIEKIGIIARAGNGKVTGVIMVTEGGTIAIVNRGRVTWLTPGEFNWILDEKSRDANASSALSIAQLPDE